MNKVLKIALILTIVLLSSLSFTTVNAATNEDTIAYLSSFIVSGKDYSKTIEDYFRKHPLSEQDADKLIAKVEEAYNLLGSKTDLNKISESDKSKLSKIAKSISSLTGINFTVVDKEVIITSKSGDLTLEPIQLQGLTITRKSQTSPVPDDDTTQLEPSDNNQSSNTSVNYTNTDEKDTDNPKTGVVSSIPVVLTLITVATLGLALAIKKD